MRKGNQVSGGLARRIFWEPLMELNAKTQRCQGAKWRREISRRDYVIAATMAQTGQRMLVERSPSPVSSPPGRRFHQSHFLVLRMTVRPIPSLEISKARRTILLLLGEKAGMREVQITTAHWQHRRCEIFVGCEPTISQSFQRSDIIGICRSYGACEHFERVDLQICRAAGAFGWGRKFNAKTQRCQGAK